MSESAVGIYKSVDRELCAGHDVCAGQLREHELERSA